MDRPRHARRRDDPETGGLTPPPSRFSRPPGCFSRRGRVHLWLPSSPRSPALGVLRLVLAWYIIQAHAGTNATAASRLCGAWAVFLFYAISGFYMTLGLRGRYESEGGIGAYLRNRAIRILPLYLALLLLCAPFVAANDNPTRDAWSALSGGAQAVAAAGQVLPVGIEGFHWLKIEGGGLAGTGAFRDDPLPAWHLLILPTAWSLSIEVWFYLVAPLILRRSTAVRLAIAAASLVPWAAVWAGGLPADPWIYRVFPASLVFFMAGSILQTLHERGALPTARLGAALSAHPAAAAGAVAATAAALVGWRMAVGRIDGPVMVALLVPVWSVALAALPVLHDATRSPGFLSRIDRGIAWIVYPVALVHYPVIRLTGWSSSVAILAASVAASIVLHLLVQRPVNRLRSPAREAREERAPAGRKD